MKNIYLSLIKQKLSFFLFVSLYLPNIFPLQAQTECFTSVDPPTFQTIWKGPDFPNGITYGQWMTDAKQTLGPEKIWVMPYFIARRIYEYNSLADLINNQPSNAWDLPVDFDGTGAVVYNGFLYYNRAATNNMIKYDLTNKVVVLDVPLPNAGFRNTYYYQWGGFSDIDFAVDETGLWVLYSTPANDGRLVVSRLNDVNLNIIQTWNTNSESRRNMGNAFVICGVVYCTDDFYSTNTTINYKYNTHTSVGSSISIPFIQSIPGGSPYNSQITYDPTKGLLFSWNNGALQTYRVTSEVRTISTSVASNSFCAGGSGDISFSVTGTFNSGNIFTAQLSNANGSFASPTAIGTLAGTSSGTISATFPANTPPGTGYRVRVVSSNPVVTGSDNGSNITISARPTAALSGNATICSGASANLTLTLTGTAPWSVTYTDGSTPVTVNDITTSPYSISVNPTSNKTYSLVAVSDARCTGTSLSGSATISVNTPPVLTVPVIAPVNNDPGQCGASLNFAASATGTPAPSIIYKIGQTVITSPYLFPVGTTIVTAFATNSCATVSETFEVKVNDSELPVFGASGNATGDVVYLRSNTGAPWGLGGNEIALNAVFGNGNWKDWRFETVNVPSLLSNSTKFIFMEGGDFNANELKAFLQANLPAIENWVNRGGRLLLNAAPNEGGNINFGFGGVTLVYPNFTATAVASIPSHPIFAGPLSPVGTTWSGNSFGHAILTPAGAGMTKVIQNSGNQLAVLVEAKWGTGTVMFGGMTLPWFQGTYGGDAWKQPMTGNLHKNILSYLATQASDNLPKDMLVATGTDCGAIVNYTTPTATDNCPSLIVKQTTGLASGALFPVGVTTNTFEATDASGNKGFYSFKVTVQDKTLPTVKTKPLVVELDATGQVSIAAEDVNDNSSDACGIKSLAVDKTSFTCANVGDNTVTLTVTDNNDNVATATAIVTVKDVTLPVALAKALTVQLDNTGAASITPEQVDDGSNDVCGIKSLSLSQLSFDCSDLGANTVTLTVTDNNGNSNTATATITVEDKTAPTAIAQNITVHLDGNGKASITPGQINNGSNDVCSGTDLTLSLDKAEFDCSNVGTPVLVTLTVQDQSHNAASATATVTVLDEVAPMVLAKNITVLLDDEGTASITPEDVDNGSSDACGVASLQVSQTHFSCDHVGPNTVTLTVTDANGNVSTADVIVSVEDAVLPVAKAKSITVQLDAQGQVTIKPEDVNDRSSDACGIKSLTLDKTAFDCSNLGANTVTLSVTDNNGNVNVAAATVTVEDKTPPIVIARNITVQLDGNGKGTITPGQINNGSNDVCSGTDLTLSLNKTDFDCSNVGTPVVVTLTAKDRSGNAATATAIVSVKDEVAPTVLTNNVTLQLDSRGNATLTPQQVDNGSSDACGIVTLQLSQTQFTCDHVGSNIVTLTVTDKHGNVGTGTATVTVENATPVLSAITAPIVPVQVNSTISASASFSDVNLASATWDWGGVMTSGTINHTTGTITGSYTYTKPGVYTVTLNVADVCGESATAVFQYVVIFDPIGGFVTGGGWFTSPSGAYTSDPTAVGKAHFGFVSKYQKGSSVPVGNTDFQFQAGNLKFKSTAYEWLVVAGYKAMYKGVGDLNGLPGYGFQISAVDGQKKSSTTPDKFRIKIWDASGNTVYDNQMGGAADAEATTSIEGGSIVIHDGSKSSASAARLNDTEAQTSADGEEEQITLSAYPNPFKDVIHVTFPSRVNADVNIYLVDLYGKNVYEKRHQFDERGIYSVELSPSTLTQEVYLLQIKQGKQFKVLKVMKR